MKNAEKLVAHIKGLKDKIEEASEKALADGGFGDRVDEVRGWMAELDSAKKSLETLREGRSMLDSIRGLGDEPPAKAGAKSLGEHVVNMVGQRLAGLKGSKGSVSAPEWLGRKDASDPEKMPASAMPYATEYLPGLVTQRQRLQVADLFAQGTTDSAAVSWLLEGSSEGYFSAVGEGDKKPSFRVGDPELVTEAYKKTAGVIQFSDEMLEDFAFLVSEINGRGVYELQLSEERDLIKGTGSGASIRGLNATSGIHSLTKGTDTTADALFKAASAVARTSGYTADGIIMSVEDYAELRTAKDQNGQYYGGGMFMPAYAAQGDVQLFPGVWGLNTVVTPSVEKGTAYVGAFKTCGTFYTRGGIRVESTTSHGENFVSNIVTTRIERRALLAIRRPTGFAKIDLTK